MKGLYTNKLHTHIVMGAHAAAEAVKRDILDLEEAIAMCVAHQEKEKRNYDDSRECPACDGHVETTGWMKSCINCHYLYCHPSSSDN